MLMLNATKMSLRRELRVAKRERDVEKVQLLNEVLDDSDLLEFVNEAAEAEFDYQTAGDSDLMLTEFGSPLKNFLKWLVDNRAQILAFIVEIMKILAVLETPPLSPKDK